MFLLMRSRRATHGQSETYPWSLLTCTVITRLETIRYVKLYVGMRPAVGTGVVVIVTAATVLGRAPVGRVGRDRAFRRIELPGVAVVEYRLRRS